MPVPAALIAIAEFVAANGTRAAAARWGTQAVNAALRAVGRVGTKRPSVTEREAQIASRDRFSVLDDARSVGRPPGPATQAARRAANEARQKSQDITRGRRRLKTTGQFGTIAAPAVWAVGEAIGGAAQDAQAGIDQRLADNRAAENKRIAEIGRGKQEQARAASTDSLNRYANLPQAARAKQNVINEATSPPPLPPKKARTVSEGQRRAEKAGRNKLAGTFTSKKTGRDLAAVSREDLAAWRKRTGKEDISYKEALRGLLNEARGLERIEGMKKGGKVKKTKKAKTGRTAKVRGAGIAKRGVRPCKMR